MSFGIVKFDSSGSSVLATYLSTDASFLGNTSSIARDSSGNIYFPGQSAAITSLNSSLSLNWSYNLGTVTGNFGVSSDGTYAYLISSDFPATRPVLSKWDNTGAVVWANYYGANTGQSAYNSRAVCADSSGNAYICGSFFNNLNHASEGPFVMKINSSGGITWQRKLVVGANSASFESIAVDSMGFVYAGGYFASGGLLVKYDSNGVLQWQRSLAATASGRICSVIIDNANNAIVVGLGDDPQIVARVPTDGTHTGTYGALTYATTSFTDTALAESAVATGFTRASHTPTPVSVTPVVTTSTAAVVTTSM